MKLTELNLDTCKVKVILYDCAHKDIYYQCTDKQIYLKYRKAQIKHSFETFIKIMKNNDDTNILDNKYYVSEETQITVLKYDKDRIVVLDENFMDDYYKYNAMLDMYVNINRRVFAKLNSSYMCDALSVSYIKVICIV